eukprot:2112023-Rhodomonas_salina.1
MLIVQHGLMKTKTLPDSRRNHVSTRCCIANAGRAQWGATCSPSSLLSLDLCARSLPDDVLTKHAGSVSDMMWWAHQGIAYRSNEDDDCLCWPEDNDEAACSQNGG